MMIRKALMVGVFALATVCMAQNRPDYATHGRGWAVAEGNQRAHFNFEAAKPHVGDVRGKFTIETRTADGGVTVNCRVLRLAVARPAAEFGGRAVLVLRRPGAEPVRVEGECAIRVTDNRRPGGTSGTPDSVAVQFTGGDRTWNFRGAVRDGDIVVIDNRS